MSSDCRFELAGGLSAPDLASLREGFQFMAGSEGVDLPVQNLAWQVLEEICTNVMAHSGATWLELKLALRAERLHVQVRDDGHAFDLGEAIVKRCRFKLEEEQNLGMGLYMIEQLVETLDYQREKGGINRFEFEVWRKPDNGRIR